MDSQGKADQDQTDRPFSFAKTTAVRRFWRSASVWAGTLSAALLVLSVIYVQMTTPAPTKPPALQVPTRSQTAAAARMKSSEHSVGKTSEPQIRVNVTPGGVKAFELEVRGSCRLIALDTQKSLETPLPPGRIKVTATENGLKLAGVQTAVSQLELVPEQSPAIRVDGHLYRGRMRLFRRSDGKVSAVNVLPMEEYLASVVDSEMPSKFPEAARQAQAIVARTYALYQIEQADPNSVYDLLSSQRSQKYLGVEYLDASKRRLAGESESSRRVVKQTRGIVCTQRGKIFCTYYSAVCGGRTVSGREVFKDATDALAPVVCEWCNESPYYRWKRELKLEEFQKLVFVAGKKKGPPAIRAIHQTAMPGEGLIPRIELVADRDRHALSGIELRDRLPSGTLLSPQIQVSLEKDTVKIAGRGHGHGVGFCQWGAKGLADHGRNYTQIISHYFSGIRLIALYD